ncbi:hypothetical protein [Roseateles sp. LYH14W]|uniref:GntR family transcriptional regulator n=1 Tax=Pelomonas parva TaxID=3299032 RepID=A0ABW7F5I6_9BURK
MPEIPVRKKSPRAPSIALDEALERALRAYEKERLHPAPTEVVAQNLGYKTANSGTALGAIASLRYYGLIERPRDGVLAVTKNVESYKFTPDELHRRELLVGFLRTPPLFAELLEQYSSGLPSDANIRYELIQRGFLPPAAESAAAIFRRSVDFASYFLRVNEQERVERPSSEQSAAESADAYYPTLAQLQPIEPTPAPSVRNVTTSATSAPIGLSDEGDQIPVRLPGGRRAWLIIPTPFYSADKVRLKAQIDLLLAQDEEE